MMNNEIVDRLVKTNDRDEVILILNECMGYQTDANVAKLRAVLEKCRKTGNEQDNVAYEICEQVIHIIRKTNNDLILR